MVRYPFLLIFGLALLVAACGSTDANPARPAPTGPVVIGQPPTPDPAEPAIDPDGSWVTGPAFVSDVDVVQLGDGRVRFTVTGDLPTPCHEAMIDVGAVESDFRLNLEVWSRTGADEVCVQVLAPFSITAEVGGLVGGTYSVAMGGKEITTVEVPGATPSDGPTTEPYDGIFPATDWPEYERLAARVAEGHQSWSLDPLQTAASYLEQLYGTAPLDLAFNDFGPDQGEVVWPAGRVTVVRHDSDGPWVVTAAETGIVDVSISDYSNGVVYVGLVPHEPGTVEVHAGAFASEWSNEFVQDLADGQLVEVELKMATGSLPGPPRILIDVRFTDGDGTVHIAQYDVNRTDIVYDD